MSPVSQVVICFSIISVQVIGIIIWVIVSPPGISFDYDDPKRVILQCKTHNTHLSLSFVYNMFLVLLCTVYAVKTRKIPENFNEARFIGFTMYSILIIWIAFIPIYFGTTAAAGSSKSPKNNYKIQLTTMAMCLSLSATVILCCLFLPKLRVVLLKPNKNVRSKNNMVKSVYATKGAQRFTTTGTGAAAANAVRANGGAGNSLNPSVQATEKSVTMVSSDKSMPSSLNSPGAQLTKNSQIVQTFKAIVTSEVKLSPSSDEPPSTPKAALAAFPQKVVSSFRQENNTLKLFSTVASETASSTAKDADAVTSKREFLNY